MPKGYVIGAIDVAPGGDYRAYATESGAAVARHGGQFLVRGGQGSRVEGQGRSRQVVIEFPSFDAAIGFYRSPEYQQAITLRTGVAHADIVIVEGVE